MVEGRRDLSGLRPREGVLSEQVGRMEKKLCLPRVPGLIGLRVPFTDISAASSKVVPDPP